MGFYFILASKDYRVSSSTTLPFTAVRIRSSLTKPERQNQINRLSIVLKCRLYSYYITGHVWKIFFESTICTRDAVPQAEVCVRVCVCVCVCACAARSKTDQQSTLRASACPNDQIHTKYVKTASLESIHLNTVYVLKWTRTVGRKLCEYFVLVTDCFINVI